MKLTRIELRRFGQFEDAVVALDPKIGFHVIFGPNEAGKSTMLDAVRYSLYGMPAGRSTEPKYDFRHRPSTIRTALSMQLDDGSEISFARSRSTKASLLDAQTDTPTPELESALARVLIGVPREVWESKHGLNQFSMRRGADALLTSSASDESIFAAATGMSSINRVLEDLRVARRALLSDTGNAGTIHKTIESLKAAQVVVARARRDTMGYDNALSERRRLEESIAELAGRRVVVEQDRDRRTAIANVVGELVVRQELIKEQDQLKTPPKKWGQAEHQILMSAIEATTRLRAELGTHDDQIQQLQGQVEGLEISPLLVNALPTFDRLHERLESYVQSRDALPSLQAEVGTVLQQVRQSLDALKIGHDDVDDESLISHALAVLPATHASDALSSTIADLVNLEDAIVSARAELASANVQLDLVRDSSRQSVDVDDEGVIEQIRSAFDIARLIDLDVIERSRAKIDASTADLSQRAGRIVGARLDLSSCLTVALPTEDVIAEFEAQFALLAGKTADLELILEQARSKITVRQGHLRELEAGADIPDPRELDRQRLRRDQEFAPIRKSVLSGPVLDDSQAAIESYEQLVGQADTLADQIARDATRVGRMAVITADIVADEHRIVEAQTGLSDLARAKAGLHEQWEQAWEDTDFVVGSVVVMRSICTEIREIRRLYSALEIERVELSASLASVQRSREQLQAALDGLEAGGQRKRHASAQELPELLASAQRIIQKFDTSQNERAAVIGQERAARAEVVRRESDLQRLLDEQEQASAERDSAYAAVGLASGASTREARAHDGLLSATSSLLDEASRISRSATQARTVVNGLESELRSLISALNVAEVEVVGESAELAVRRLRTSCSDAVSNEAIRKQLQDQLSERERLREELRAQRVAHEATIADLCSKMGVADLPRLIDVDQDWTVYTAQAERIANLDVQIVTSAHLGLDELMTLWAQQDAAQLRAGAAECNAELESIGSQISALSKQRDEFAKLCGALEDSHEQAAALAQIADASSTLQTLVPQYRLLVIQERMLTSILDERARKDMGPVVARTSQYLSALTLGRWTQMVVGLDDADNPQVQLRRSDAEVQEDELVALSGLSEGTLDQLYLALRLSILVEGVQHGETMPLVVDDILLSFDDDRAAAALRLLAEVSEHFQVIFLTHHSHLGDLATESVTAQQVMVHEMPTASLITA